MEKAALTVRLQRPTTKVLNGGTAQAPLWLRKDDVIA